MFESVLTLLAEHDELQSQLADPELHAGALRQASVAFGWPVSPGSSWIF